MSDVIIVGAGIIGISIAFRLAQRGAHVTLVDAESAGSGTSSTSVAWTNANNKSPFEYYSLNVAGMGEHETLAIEFGGAPWLHRSANVEWALDESGTTALQAKVDRLRSWGYAAEFVDRAELERFEPEIVPPDSATAIAIFPLEHYVEPLRLIATLLARFRELGGEVTEGRRVAHITTDGDRARGITLEDGTTMEAPTVVTAVGRWTETLLGERGIRMAPTTSLLAVTSAVPTRLHTMVQSPEINFRPDGGGRVLLQDNRLDETGDARDLLARDPGAAERLLASAQQVVPSLARATIERAVVGVRSIPYDGLPVVGYVPGIRGLYAVATHSGVTLGPWLGRIVAREIAGAPEDARLAPFRPGRFLAVA